MSRTVRVLSEDPTQPEPSHTHESGKQAWLQCSWVRTAICREPRVEGHPVVRMPGGCGCGNARCPQQSCLAALLVRPPNVNEATGYSSRAQGPARRSNMGPELRGNVVLLLRQPLARLEGKGASKEHSRRKSRRLHQARRHELGVREPTLTAQGAGDSGRGRAPVGRGLGGHHAKAGAKWTPLITEI